MSRLEDLCRQLDAVAKDSIQWAAALHGHARELYQKAQALTGSIQQSNSSTGRQAIIQLLYAAKRAETAAALLNNVDQKSREWITASISGNGSEGGSSKKNVSSGSDYADGQNAQAGVLQKLEKTAQTHTTAVIAGVTCNVFDHPNSSTEKFAVVNQGSLGNGSAGTCGLCASGTVCNKITNGSDKRFTEKLMYDFARPEKLCSPSGGTSSQSWATLITELTGEPMCTPFVETLPQLAERVESGHAVIIGVNAWDYKPEWYNSNGGHALVLESVVRDVKTNEIVGYYVIDSNGTSAGNACQYVEAGVLTRAYEKRGYTSAATENIIW